MSQIKSVTFAILMIGVALVLVTCGLLGSGSQNDEDELLITDRAALEGMEAVGGMMSALFDGCGEPGPGEAYPDFDAGAYPAGMTVTESNATDQSVTLSVSATDVTPEPEPGKVAEDVVVDADFTIGLTVSADGSQITIEMNGTMDLSGSDAPFASLAVYGAMATIPIVNDELGEPSDMVGTLTVDGESFAMSRIDLDAPIDEIDATLSPLDAHYFQLGYRVDGGVDRPQIIYTDTTHFWGTINLAGEGAFRAGAIDESGMIVAVGENGLIYSTSDGATWTDRSVPSVSADLEAVTVSSTTWIAAGDGVILRSTDGVSWSTVWTASAGERLFAVAEYAPGEWLAAGQPPHSLVRSDDDGLSWTTEIADPDNRPTQVIRELFFTADTDTPWVALAGDAGFPGGVFDGADPDADGDMDWTPADTSASFMAGARREGVMVGFGVSGGPALYRSVDAGDSWSVVQPSASINGYPAALVAIGNGFLGLTNMGGLIRGSADGSTWEVLTAESYGSFALVFRR